MASSMKVWHEIVMSGATKRRRKNAVQVAAYIEDGADADEANRRVHRPWMTIEQYREMKADYERAFDEEANADLAETLQGYTIVVGPTVWR